jgi:hypothetical protein
MQNRYSQSGKDKSFCKRMLAASKKGNRLNKKNRAFVLEQKAKLIRIGMVFNAVF